MQKIIEVLKKNWALVILVLIVGNYLFRSIFGVSMMSMTIPSDSTYSKTASFGAPAGTSLGGISLNSGLTPRTYDTVAPSESKNRMVVTDTSLSMQVKNVRETVDKIQTFATGAGGFMVNSYLNTPEGGSSGNITLRLPSANLKSSLETIRSFGVKVVSESVSGNDVTAQYEDLNARLDVLNRTKQKFENIMTSAVTVSDLLNVQRELINLQSQIDAVMGQKQYLEKTSELSLVSVYLSTDELALPYTPSDSWRPTVVFKSAVRSLISNVRSFANLGIWAVVYSPLIALGYVGLRVLRKRKLI